MNSPDLAAGGQYAGEVNVDGNVGVGDCSSEGSNLIEDDVAGGRQASMEVLLVKLISFSVSSRLDTDRECCLGWLSCFKSFERAILQRPKFFNN